MPNRNPIKQWFITFPQSAELSKEDFFQVHQTLGEISYAKAALESHEDGSPHLHLLLILKKGITKSNLLKFYKNTYPDDYKRIDCAAIRNIMATLQYLEKEDDEFFETMPYAEFNPAMARCETARKVKFYNSQVSFFNDTFRTHFKTGRKLYEFLQKYPNIADLGPSEFAAIIENY